MSQSAKNNKPAEYASKFMHTHFMKDSAIKDVLDTFITPLDQSKITLDEYSGYIFDYNEVKNPIENIIAFDGGYTEVTINESFPSSLVAFFQFGASLFTLSDLNNISKCPFIFPEDMAKLKRLDRLKLVLPIKNIALKDGSSFSASFRKVLYNFFMKKSKNGCFIETLYWLIFEEFDGKKDDYILSSDPNSDKSNVRLNKNEMKSDYTFNIDGKIIYLTDVFRLHEIIDDELGASGVLGYVTNLIENLMIAHFIKYLLENKPDTLNNALFIKDGPLAFFGQTANMHKIFRRLSNYLLEKHNLFLVGVEKSGAFVDHADQITKIKFKKDKDGNRVDESLLKSGKFILLSNKYIYKYILPGNPDNMAPYAHTSYYGGKLIFKTKDNDVYVLTVPVKNDKIVLNPTKPDFNNIDVILTNISKLRCDMYTNSLIPISLVNQLISIANHPSSSLLQKFAKNEMSK